MIGQAAQEVAKQPQNFYQLIALVITVIIAQVPLWIREWRKSRTFKEKNGQLDEIKKAVDDTDERTQEMDLSLGIIKTDVKNQKQKCSETVVRMEKGLQQHSNQILELARNGAKKD